MITIFTENCNTISKKEYEYLLTSIDFTSLTCTCGHSGCLTKHGYYNKTVKSMEDKIFYSICRVKCSSCGVTHALLHSSMVPYSQISLELHVSIISSQYDKSKLNILLHNYLSIDESSVSYILRQFHRHWKQRLLSQSISLSCIKNLIFQCFHHYSRQFMQIRSTNNILFIQPT